MTLAELRAAVRARGFADDTDAQIDQLVNDACVELDSMFQWPYREKSTTGTPVPLSIPDLGEVEEVLDMTTGFPLTKASWGELTATYGDTSVAGVPLFWYVASPEGVPELSTFPTSSRTIGVQYWCMSPVLVADSDVPLAPAGWHSVIVDIAAGAAYPDGETPQGLQARIDRRVAGMVNALMADSGPTYVQADGVDC